MLAGPLSIVSLLLLPPNMNIRPAAALGHSLVNTSVMSCQPSSFHPQSELVVLTSLLFSCLIVLLLLSNTYVLIYPIAA